MADAPVELTEVAAAAHGGEIWVAGGLTGAGEPVTDVWRYDPGTDAWAEGTALPVAVHHSALVSTGEDLLLIGGWIGPGFGEPTDAVWRLAADDAEWEPGPALPSARAAGAAAWDGERVVYGGGVTADGITPAVLALAGDEWTEVAAMDPRREHLAAASDGAGRTWLLGGRTGRLTTNLPSVDLVEGASASSLGDVLTPRGGVSGFFAPRIGACAAGGEQPNGTFDAVECVDATGQVTVLPQLGVARHGTGAAVIDGVAYVVMGGPAPLLSVSSIIEALELPTN